MEAERKLLKFCKTGKKIVIYGAGKGGASVERFLTQNGITPYCFCVSQIDERNTYMGYPIKEIAEVRRELGEGVKVIVAISEKFAEEML